MPFNITGFREKGQGNNFKSGINSLVLIVDYGMGKGETNTPNLIMSVHMHGFRDPSDLNLYMGPFQKNSIRISLSIQPPTDFLELF